MPAQRLNQRIIKKYPNRRLYDPAQRRYITVADVRKLVQQRVKFKVLDYVARTNVTDLVLLQAIVEQHEAGRPVLSRAQLERALRTRRGK